MSQTSLEKAAKELAASAGRLSFSSPVACAYNPLSYAWEPHANYLSRYGDGPKRAVFLGMNPGPFGMVQTGVPFGDVVAVRDWLGIRGTVAQPPDCHPKRPVWGFACPRREVSGQRLWGLFQSRFGTPEEFFKDHFVANYCPLAFVEPGGRNHTPDKLPKAEKQALFEVCDRHLRSLVRILRPRWVIGVGDFAANRAAQALSGQGIHLGKILHPSPACPAANRNWAGQAASQLEALEVWEPRTYSGESIR